MPFVNLRTVKGLLNDEQKQYLMEKFIQGFVQQREAKRPFGSP